jgi:hypothetical protein
MRELKKGTDLSDLVEMVIVADKDGDDDYYVAVRFKYTDAEGDPVAPGENPDLRALSQFYIRDYRLQGAITAADNMAVAKALTDGGIENIEAFLEG